MTSLVLVLALTAQYPQQPDKQLPQASVPSKSTPLASPQVQAAPLPTPQAAYDVPAQAPVVLRSIPSSYTVSRVIVQSAPVQYQTTVLQDVAPMCQVAYAGTGGCGVAQQQVFQRGIVGHSVVVNHGLQSAQVDHGLIANGVGRQPKKIKTKQVTRVKRGLFGR